MTQERQHLETLAVHAGQVPDPTTGSRAVPIYQTTSYVFNDAQHAADLFALRAFGNIYTRIMNPTNDVLEKRLAALHGGTGALTTASGQSAIFYAIAAITKAGQNIVTGSNLYGGTYALFVHTLKRFGIEVRFVDSSKPEAVKAAIDENTRLVYTESVGNPRGNVDDFEALAKIAHDAGIPFVVDNTFTPPPLHNPFDFGADVVVYSLTKMIGGHGTSIGGAIVEKGDFNWANGKFPEISEPDPSYHGVNFWAAFGNHPDAVAPGLAYVLKIRTGLLRDIGAALSPFNAQQIILGVETLPLRARVHAENARKVAEWLEKHPAVTEVFNFLELLGTSWEFFAVVAVAGLALIARWQLWTGLPRVVLAMSCTFAATSPLKPLIDRPRPSGDLTVTVLAGPSMPSSHAILTTTVVVAVLLAPWWTSRRLRLLAGVAGATGCLVAGVAMVYLGGHWLSDVVVGWALGVGITAIGMLAFKRLGLD